MNTNFMTERSTSTETKPVRVVRRYANRKFYDVENSRYINAPELLALYRAEPGNVVVIDNKTKEDITLKAVANSVFATQDAATAEKIVGLVRTGIL